MTRTLAWKLAAGLLLAALVSMPAVAQQGRGRGGFGFGGGNSLIRLAGNEAVQKELGLGEAEKSKVETISQEYGDAMREEMQAAGGGGNFQDLSDDERQKLFAKIREISTKVNETYEPKLKEALTADQFKRLQEISVQAGGVDAISDPRVAKELALTEEQTKKIADLRADYREKMRGLFGPDAGDDARTKMRELREEETKAVTEVLTKEQQDKLTALKGKEFDVSQLRGRGGQGGGRRERPKTE